MIEAWLRRSEKTAVRSSPERVEQRRVGGPAGDVRQCRRAVQEIGEVVLELDLGA